MAGGDTNDIRTPYPKTRDVGILVQSIPVNIVASQTYRFDEMELPFKCKIVKAEVTAYSSTVTNGVTITVEDDTGTAKKFVDAKSSGTSITAGTSVRTALEVDKTVVFFAGSLLRFEYTSLASDVSVNTVVRIWVVPVH